nr:MAG TPA: hypothetical protein [Caudoviricetes sp.]DAH89263.1 MAG TPA: hypothetical protein [Caudoviricetes sp.]
MVKRIFILFSNLQSVRRYTDIKRNFTFLYWLRFS